ncbi:MAG: HEPN domain-containing protein [bacterium]
MNRKNPEIASIQHYPRPVKDGIELIRDMIVERFHPEMIILFGSIATKKWTWKSDIDLLIVADTTGRPHLELDIRNAISKSEKIKQRVSRIISPVVVSPEELNDRLQVGHYFFSEIIDKGKLLYNTGRFSLAEMRKLEPVEYAKLVQDDFDDWRKQAEGAYKGFEFYLPEKEYRWAAFNLHQIVECSSVMAELVFTRYRSKTHDLDKLMEKLIAFVNGAAQIFPQDTDFQRQAYKRLYKAYVSGRYHKTYRIEEEELKYLGERVKLLLDMAIKSCEEEIRRIHK